jgi:hypothetical protein
MFDFHKGYFSQVDSKTLKGNLEFKTTVNTRTGEEYTDRCKTQLDGLTLDLIDDRVLQIRGSFHKYKNDGRHNYDDFTLREFKETYMRINRELGIEIGEGSLNNLEFGINVSLPFAVDTVLKNIVSYKCKSIGREFFNGQGNMVRVQLGQYELKMYDKGKQYKQPGNLIRIEIKVKRMNYLRTKGIHVKQYKDLLNPAVYSQLKNLLLETIDELLIHDEVDILNVAKKSQELIERGKDPLYWIESKKENHERFKKRRKRFNQLMQEHGKNDIKTTLKQRIIEKFKKIAG